MTVGPMGIGSGMPSSVARLITLDHERLSRLLRRAVAPGPSQNRWRDECARLLISHLRAERTVLADFVPADAGGAIPDRDLEHLSRALAAAPVPSPDIPALGESLAAALERHARQLSSGVLEPLAASLRRKEIRDLGGRYEAVRDEVLHEQGAEEPPPRRLDLPRAQLYELARKAGVEGRSGMSRSELIAELQRRTGA